MRTAVVIAAIILASWMAYEILPAATQGGMSIQEGARRVQELFSEDTTVYYSYDVVPDVLDRDAPLEALDLALRTWEVENPGLEFVHHEWSDIRIRWMTHGAATHSGLATCKDAALRDRCILDISIGGTGCDGIYVQAEHYTLANLIMHETGHALGIGHTIEEGHLMYSTEDPEDPLDTRGYTIPARHEDLASRVDEIGHMIEEARTSYEGLLAEYQEYGGRALPEPEYAESLAVHAVLEKEQENLNSMIQEYNGMVGRLNAVSAVMPCPAG